MGIYINPGNGGFQEIINSEYVDKTGLLRLINDSIDTVNNLISISRPRRFGKSYAAKMLFAYYGCSCDSHSLFDDKEIAGTEGYLAHLNQYQVINLDITTFLSAAQRKGIPLKEVPDRMVARLMSELEEMYPDCAGGGEFSDCLVRCVEKTGRKFVFVIDEWDALIREARDDTVAQKRYLGLLREWFKSNNFTSKVVAAAYMTGILPIKKDGSQSAISDFREYTILDPCRFVEYTGFTESDVRSLCGKYGMDFEEVRQWYDGYIAAMEQYLKVEELPSGKGIADVVYLPKRKSLLPAMIVELKWDKSSEGAIRQIKERNYPSVLEDYGGEIVLVGINYHSKTKAHTCEIERI